MKGIWISPNEIRELPTTGAAWTNLLMHARQVSGRAGLRDKDNDHDVHTLAKALVAVRLGNVTLMNDVRQNIAAVIGTEQGGRSLALGRNLTAYVVSADLVGLEPSADTRFRSWLRELLSKDLQGRSLRSTHEDRPNNWGTHAGAARAAIAAYLNDSHELERTAQVFRGYLGDRSSYAGFKYGEPSWQADPDRPVGINPLGAVKHGYLIDGVMPDDMRRGGPFQSPPLPTGYPWEALQGAAVQAEILHRQGYDAWCWEEQAILRAVRCLYRLGWPAQGDDEWLVHIFNARYGTAIPAASEARHGKNMGWTDWTHQRPDLACDQDARP